jgi:hypothetical protein
MVNHSRAGTRPSPGSSPESLGPDGRGQVGFQHLQRDQPVVLEIPRQEHPRHAAPAEFPFDGVGTGQAGLEGRKEIRHANALPGEIPAG